MAKAIADRLAEAFAEYLHQRARRAWGYGTEESLDTEDLLRERFRGIRPAYGYPACPDLGMQQELFRVLQPEDIGVFLTEGDMMEPEASVSAIVVHHPDARYFAVDRITRDQVPGGHRRGRGSGGGLRDVHSTASDSPRRPQSDGSRVA